MKNLTKLKNHTCEDNPVYQVKGTKYYIARASTAYINEVYIFTMNSDNNLVDHSCSADNLKDTAQDIIDNLK